MTEGRERETIGIAFDLGTTTIVGSSVLSRDRRVLKTISLSNPQARWGGDVLSRITAIKEDEGLLGVLSRETRDALNEISGELAAGCEIREMTLAGNSVMEHILLGVSPEPIARPPFRPVFRESRRLRPGDAGLKAPGDAALYTFPLIGGFVGGDAVAVALALDLPRRERTVLAVDIGTNSEILLGTPGGLFVTSAAAGPAFEGGEISCGMRAERGALQALCVEEDSLRLDVIGGVTPVGICGSGLVDAVAALLGAGVVEPSGRVRNRDEVGGGLSDRIREGAGGNSFVLFRGPGGEVAITQQDVRALQAAKSAIRAGMNLLLERAGAGPEEVEEVYIAGAFGSHLRKEGLERIGLIDRSWLERTVAVGDAALEGAKAALFSEEKKREADEIAGRAKLVSLSGSRHFEREFIRNMSF